MIVRKVKCNRLCGLGMWPCLENVCRILRGNPVGEWQTERHRRRWKESIRTGLREINFHDQRRVKLAQDHV